MRNASPILPIRYATETASNLDLDGIDVVQDTAVFRNEGPSFFAQSFPHTSETSYLRSMIGRWIFAVTAATVPIAYVDNQQELRRSGASSIVWMTQRRRGQTITLSEARSIALNILSNTEQRLREERASEARFILDLWGDQDLAAE